MSEKTLKVGAAKLPISPKEDMLPLLLAFSGDSYEAVREGEGLTVRAIVVDNGETRFLFEAFELGGVPCPDYLNAKIEEVYGLTKDHTLLTGTHNHAAPFLLDPNKKMPPMSFRETDTTKVKRYTDYVLEQSIRVIGMAIEKLQPAKYGFATDKSYINVNRDEHFDDGFWMQGKNWEGCSDKTLAALKFTDLEGNLIAAVLNYAVHDVLNFCAKDVDGKVKVSSGIPGVCCNYLEKYFGNDCVVAWQSGAAGNQNPYIAYAARYDDNGSMYSAAIEQIPGVTYFNTVCMGEQHAIDALRALKKAEANRTTVDIRTVDSTLYLPGQRFPEGIDQAAHRLMVDNIVGLAGMKTVPASEKKLAEMIPVEEKVPCRSQLVLFDDVAFYGVAGEVYNEIAMLCKEASPYKNTMITTHIGAHPVGYILDDASRDHKVFQSFGAVRPGENNGILVKGMLDMFEKAREQ